MKDGIGEGFTRADHPDLSNQLFSAYSKVQEVRSLAQVIGEDELTPTDKKYLKFGEVFEREFINQGQNENRTMEQTLELGWRILSILPVSELDRLDQALLDQYYVKSNEDGE